MTFVKRMTGAAALGAALLVGADLSTPPAQAGYVVALTEQAGNVVASGSGAIDLTGLTFFGNETRRSIAPQINPGGSIGFPVLLTGPTTLPLPLNSAYLLTNGPMSFGSIFRYTNATFGTGDGNIGLWTYTTGMTLFVPLNYQSETFLTSSSTFTDTTIEAIGVTPGTYEWTWGTGSDQNFTLEAGSSPIPPFAGTPGRPNCTGQSVSALAQQYGGIANAASQLGFSSVSDLQNAVATFCATGFIASPTQTTLPVSPIPPTPSPTSVPEPSALTLLTTALAGLFLFKLRENRRDRQIRPQHPGTV